MRKASYLAVFEPCGEGYSVFFPDLPGCISCWNSFEEAQRKAEAALIDYIRSRGKAIPNRI